MGNYDSVKYEKSFLKQVILRIDFFQFVPSSALFCAELEEIVSRFFPHKGKNQIIRFNSINMVFNPQNSDSPNAKGESQEGFQIEYYSSDRTNKIVVSNKFLIFDIQEYSTFDVFFQCVQTIVDSLVSITHLTASRTGIRYINILDSTSIKIRKNFFSHEVAATLDTKSFSGKPFSLVRSMHITEYKIDKLCLNFRYGLFNPQYPNSLSNYSFTLDYDCFVDEQINSIEEILQFVKNGHNAIQEVFESSISDVLRKIMKNE